jgi:hypothetical protein
MQLSAHACTLGEPCAFYTNSTTSDVDLAPAAPPQCCSTPSTSEAANTQGEIDIQLDRASMLDNMQHHTEMRMLEDAYSLKPLESLSISRSTSVAESAGHAWASRVCAKRFSSQSFPEQNLDVQHVPGVILPPHALSHAGVVVPPQDAGQQPPMANVMASHTPSLQGTFVTASFGLCTDACEAIQKLKPLVSHLPRALEQYQQSVHHLSRYCDGGEASREALKALEVVQTLEKQPIAVSSPIPPFSRGDAADLQESLGPSSHSEDEATAVSGREVGAGKAANLRQQLKQISKAQNKISSCHSCVPAALPGLQCFGSEHSEVQDRDVAVTSGSQEYHQTMKNTQDLQVNNGSINGPGISDKATAAQKVSGIVQAQSPHAASDNSSLDARENVEQPMKCAVQESLSDLQSPCTGMKSSLDSELPNVHSCREAWASVADVSKRLMADMHAVALQKNCAAAEAGAKAKAAADRAQLIVTQGDTLGAVELHEEARMWQLKADKLAEGASEALQMADNQAKEREAGLNEFATMSEVAAALTFTTVDELERHESSRSEAMKGFGVSHSPGRPHASTSGAADKAPVTVDTLHTWLQAHHKHRQASDKHMLGEGPTTAGGREPSIAGSAIKRGCSAEHSEQVIFQLP